MRRSEMRWSIVFVPILMLLVGSAAAPASGYVRTRSSKGTGIPTYWPGGCVFVQPDSDASIDLAIDQVSSILSRALNNWNSATSSCSYLQLKAVDPTPLEAHYDGVNVVKFRKDVWCH